MNTQQKNIQQKKGRPFYYQNILVIEQHYFHFCTMGRGGYFTNQTAKGKIHKVHQESEQSVQPHVADSVPLDTADQLTNLFTEYRQCRFSCFQDNPSSS